MNEFLVFALVLIGIIVLIMFFQFINSLRDDKLYLSKLQSEFGKVHRSSYDHDRLNGADLYHRRHVSDCSIDDITWSDLSMNEIMARIDTTESESGRQVLYHMLRTPLTDISEIHARRGLIDMWRNNPTLRGRMLILLHRIGRLNRVSVYDLMESTDTLDDPSFVPYYVRTALLVLAFLSIYVLSGIGVVIFIVILLSNLYVYYRDRSRILPYMKVYLHILRLIDSSDMIVRELTDKSVENEYLSGIADRMSKTLDVLKPLKNKSSILLGSEMGNNPLYLVLNLVGVIVYADIIRFYRLKGELIKRRPDIDALIGLTGGIDATIAMAGYVESISGHLTNAVFGTMQSIRVREITHPLIENAVPNDIIIDTGILLTGANASGKSTFLKSIALAAIYAQSMGYVCAASYEAPVCMVSSAMSIKDDVTEGDSYYMAEIKAVKRMIDKYADVNKKESGILPLCLVDELLNGTNTEERIAACTQILGYMDSVGIRVLAATHDGELTDTLGAQYTNYHFEEDLSDGDVRFSYKLREGRTESRNAIRLLAALGFDEQLTDKAKRMVELHESAGIWKPV